MSNLNKVMSVYNSSTSIEHKITVIKWAKKVLSPMQMEWFVFTICKQERFDLVLQSYKEAV